MLKLERAIALLRKILERKPPLSPYWFPDSPIPIMLTVSELYQIEAVIRQYDRNNESAEARQRLSDWEVLQARRFEESE